MLDTFRTCSELGASSLGAYIISMCMAASDVLLVRSSLMKIRPNMSTFICIGGSLSTRILCNSSNTTSCSFVGNYTCSTRCYQDDGNVVFQSLVSTAFEGKIPLCHECEYTKTVF